PRPPSAPSGTRRGQGAIRAGSQTTPFQSPDVTGSWLPLRTPRLAGSAGSGEQIAVVDHHPQPTRRRVRHAPTGVLPRPLDELRPLLAGGGQPPGEPLRRQRRVLWAEPPRAGPHLDVHAAAAERRHASVDRVRSEQRAPVDRPTLMRIERVGDLLVERVSRKEFHPTNN